MKIDGSCHCGFLTYEAEIDPDNVMICHCTDCQRLSGSAYRFIALTNKGSFRFTSGAPSIYVRIGDSGAARPQSFCPKCGSPIYSTSDDDGPKIHSLRAGTINQRDQLVPKSQIWCRSRAGWAHDLSQVRAVEKEQHQDL